MKTKLRASTSIPYEIKVVLDSLGMSNERPPELLDWSRRVFRISRKFERTNEEIAEWVEQWALEKDYSDRQIRRVLKDNGYVKHPEFANKPRGGHMSAYNYINELKDLVKAVTELDDDSVEKAHNAAKLASQAEPNITHIATQGSTAEKESLLHYVQLTIALLQRLEKSLLEKAKGVQYGT